MKPYMPLFKLCTSKRRLSQLHGYLLVFGFQRNPLASTKLIETYAKMGDLESSQIVFNSFQNPDSFMWGVLIKSYVWNSMYKEAISIFSEMLYNHQTQLCSFIFPSLLKSCCGLGDVSLGKKIHGGIIKRGFEFDQVVQTSLLCMYGGERGGSLDFARKVFADILVKDLVTWSSMILSYIKNGKVIEGLELFYQMVVEGINVDSVTMLSVTEACSDMGCCMLAKSVHCYIVRNRIQIVESLENSIIVMYSKCGDLKSAEIMYKRSSNNNRDCLDVFEKKPLGLLSLLDEESNFSRPTDLMFANKPEQHLNANPCFKGESGGAFIVFHYAGEVLYQTNGFLEKNRDPLHSGSIQLLSSCSRQLLQLFACSMQNPSSVKPVTPLRRLSASDSQKQSAGTNFKVGYLLYFCLCMM
ncbi:hypothetical protein MKX01_023921 [Papaver californicum]|nr:hypothetical protein MKX01_023921 [Papaver californicum]